MYWFNIRRLHDDLAAGPLSERENFSYFLANTICVTLALSLPMPEPSDWRETADLVASAIVMVLGAWGWYIANGGKSGSDFLGRVNALVWVVSIRLLIYSLPLLAFLLLTAYMDFTQMDWYAFIYPFLDVLAVGFYTLWSIVMALWVRLRLQALQAE